MATVKQLTDGLRHSGQKEGTSRAARPIIRRMRDNLLECGGAPVAHKVSVSAGL